MDADPGLNFVPTERAVFESSFLPPDAPFLTVIDDSVVQQATKKIKSGPLRVMKNWTDAEKTILLRLVKANFGHIKTGTLDLNSRL